MSDSDYTPWDVAFPGKGKPVIIRLISESRTKGNRFSALLHIESEPYTGYTVVPHSDDINKAIRELLMLHVEKEPSQNDNEAIAKFNASDWCQ